MPSFIPHFELTIGQVGWVLSLGNPPSRITHNQLRYMLRVGVPFSEEELRSGRGHHLAYGFDHLVELGLALYVIRRGMKPAEAGDYLVKQRKTLRKLFHTAWKQQPDAILQSEWLKSRGRIHAVLAEEVFLRMHRRYSGTPGKIETVDMSQATRLGAAPGDIVEQFADGEATLLVPLTRLMLEWAVWALEAPEMKRGRVSG